MEELKKGDAEQGVCPPAGSGAEPRWGGEAPRSYGHYATFTTHNKRKLQYKDVYNCYRLYTVQSSVL